MEQVISQQPAESEEPRHNILDDAIRQLQEHQDRQVVARPEGVPVLARVPEPGTPRRGAWTFTPIINTSNELQADRPGFLKSQYICNQFDFLQCL